MLHDRIRAEIERRQAIARKATASPWARDETGDVYAIRRPPITTHIAEVDSTKDAEHIALHDPADALRWYAAALRVLDRHQPIMIEPEPEILFFDRGPWCSHGGSRGLLPIGAPKFADCPEIRDLAESLGVAVEGDDNV